MLIIEQLHYLGCVLVDGYGAWTHSQHLQQAQGGSLLHSIVCAPGKQQLKFC